MHYIVISSPSGGGKTTICNMLLQNEVSPIYNNVSFSISATTRPKREHELHGREYFFLSHNEFNSMIAKDEFLEYATVCGNLYGTPIKGVSKEKHTLFDIDFQGFEQIQSHCKKYQKPLLSIFLLPPSLDVLRQRLQSRGDIRSDVIEARMENAISEILHSQKYDFILTNHNISSTFANVSNIVKSVVCNSREVSANVQSIANSIRNIVIANDINSYLNEALKITKGCQPAL
jgi:guanylate kinase